VAQLGPFLPTVTLKQEYNFGLQDWAFPSQSQEIAPFHHRTGLLNSYISISEVVSQHVGTILTYRKLFAFLLQRMLHTEAMQQYPMS